MQHVVVVLARKGEAVLAVIPIDKTKHNSAEVLLAYSTISGIPLSAMGGVFVGTLEEDPIPKVRMLRESNGIMVDDTPATHPTRTLKPTKVRRSEDDGK